MFNQLQKKIRKFFGISRTEANGFSVLLICTIALIISPLLYRQLGKGGYRNYQQDKILLDSIIRRIRLVEDQGYTNNSTIIKTVGDPDFINPNEISFQHMISLGFDSIIAKRIVSYRNKGGKFEYKQDLLRIYDFPQELYDKINSYVNLPGQISNLHELDNGINQMTEISPANKGEVKELLFDLNKVDTTQLMLLKGIGPVFSKRILKYREILGGFVHEDQLNEVYGLPAKSLEDLKRAVFIDSLFIPEKIKINFVEWRELVKHPYIQSDLANKILDNRSISGPFIDGDDFKKRLIFPDSIKKHIISYIEF